MSSTVLLPVNSTIEISLYSNIQKFSKTKVEVPEGFSACLVHCGLSQMCYHRRWSPTLSSSGHDRLKLVNVLKAKKVVGNDRFLGANPKVTPEHLSPDAEVLAGGMGACEEMDDVNEEVAINRFNDEENLWL